MSTFTIDKQNIFMKRLFATTVYILSFVIMVQAQQAAPQWKLAMEQYNYSMAIGLLETQLDSLRNILDTIQDSTIYVKESHKLKELLLHKATCQKNLYKFTQAINTLDQALQTGGEDAATYTSIAECHRLMGNDIAAYMFYENAVRMAPDNLFLRIQKMMLNYKMEEFGKCIVEGQEILQEDTIPTILVTVGNSFNKTQMSDSALVYYSKAYGMNPYDYRTLEKISNIHLMREKYDTVLSLTQNYLKKDSANYVINPIKGLAQYGLKDYRNAYETFSKSLEYGCDPYSGYYYLGLCKFMDKEYREAIEWFKKAMQLDSSDANIPYYIGLCYSKESPQYYETAEWYLNLAESMLQPDSTMMYKINATKVDVFMNSAQFDRAVKQLKVAQRYGELQPAQLSALGYAYRRMKDYENAMKYYNKYLKVGKQGSAVWKFVEEEMAFIKEELFMQEGKEPSK